MISEHAMTEEVEVKVGLCTCGSVLLELRTTEPSWVHWRSIDMSKDSARKEHRIIDKTITTIKNPEAWDYNGITKLEEQLKNISS